MIEADDVNERAVECARRMHRQTQVLKWSSGFQAAAADCPVDGALTDGEEAGFVKIHIKKGTDKILGATIVALHAGSMISEMTTAMAGNIGLKKIASIIHTYPT